MCGIYHRRPVDQVHPEVLPKWLGGASLEASVTLRLARAKGVEVVGIASAGHPSSQRSRDQMHHRFLKTVNTQHYDLLSNLRVDIPKCVLDIALGARADRRCAKAFETPA